MRGGLALPQVPSVRHTFEMKQSAAPLTDRKILVVDDEEGIREILREELEFLGATVFDSANGRKAFELFSSNPVEVIVSDIRMPGGDGLELLDRVKSIDVQFPPMLFMTGFADIAFEAAYHRGIEGVLAKPFVTQEILDRVGQFLKPVTERNQTPHSLPPKNSLTRTFTSEFSVEGYKELQFGRGGFCLSGVQDELRMQDPVSFQFTFTGAIQSFAGQGVVRWKRVAEENTGLKILGVEITYLDPASRKIWLEQILPKNQRAYIPSV